MCLGRCTEAEQPSLGASHVDEELAKANGDIDMEEDAVDTTPEEAYRLASFACA